MNSQETIQQSKEREYIFQGLGLIKLIHCIIQILFIPLALSRLYDFFQIIIPLPVGIWIILSIIANIFVFSLYNLANSPKFTLKINNKDSSENLIIKTRISGKKQNFIIKNSEEILEFGSIHSNFSWTFVQFLSYLWNSYLIYEGFRLILINAFNQGIPLFSYGLVSLISYLVIWFLPDREIALRNHNKSEIILIIVPRITLNLFGNKKDRNQYQNQKIIMNFEKWRSRLSSDVPIIKKFSELNQSIENRLDLRRDRDPYRKLLIIETICLFLIFSIASTLTFQFYQYQAVDSFIYVTIIINLRKLINKDPKEAKRPWYFYAFIGFAVYEMGIKAWYITAMMYLIPMNPLTYIYLIISWMFYLIGLGIMFKEIQFNFKYLNNFPAKNKILSIISIFSIIILVILPITSYFSTLGLINFYISIIELGPII